MQDRILSAALRLIIVGLISVIALATFIAAYQGLYLAVTGQFHQTAGRLAGSLALGSATALLIRYRGDLLDERH